MNYELWITIHSFVIALVAGASLYSAKSQIKRENVIWEKLTVVWENLCALSVITSALKRENSELKKEIAELKKEGEEK